MKHKKGHLPDWRIDQVRKLSLRVAEQNFAQMIRSEMRERGWRYDAGNNIFTKSGIQLYFSDGIGSFTREGCDGRLSKILHRFNILPEVWNIKYIIELEKTEERIDKYIKDNGLNL